MALDRIVEQVVEKADGFTQLAREASAPISSQGLEYRGLPPIEVAIIIALTEEFEYIQTLLPPEKDRNTSHLRELGCTEFIFKHRVPDGRSYHCLVRLVNDMGEVETALATQHLLLCYRPRLIVNIGISGGTDADLKLGDVVAADSVNRYLANSKAVPGLNAADIKFQMSNRTSDCCSLCKFASALLVRNGSISRRWQAAAKKDYSRLVRGKSESVRKRLRGLIERSRLRLGPKLSCGPIASGPSVAGSDAFRELLKSRDRKFQAVDMESGGFMAALRRTKNPPRELILRGISDFADERKSVLDKSTRNLVREFAIRNAYRALQALLDDGLLDQLDSPAPVAMA